MTDEELEPIVEKYRQIVIDQGGEVDQAGKWERRRLAYEVKGRREGIYVLMNFKCEPAAANELERVLKLDEAVLRQIVVRFEPGKSMLIRLDKLAEARQPEAAEAVPKAEETEAAPEAEAVEAETEPVAEAEATEAEAVEEEASTEEAVSAEAEVQESQVEEAPITEEASVEEVVAAGEAEEASVEEVPDVEAEAEVTTEEAPQAEAEVEAESAPAEAQAEEEENPKTE